MTFVDCADPVVVLVVPTSHRRVQFHASQEAKPDYQSSTTIISRFVFLLACSQAP